MVEVAVGVGNARVALGEVGAVLILSSSALVMPS